MFQNQRELPGLQHVFGRLGSVASDEEALAVAEPFPTEALVPVLIEKALEEQRSARRPRKALGTFQLVLGLGMFGVCLLSSLSLAEKFAVSLFALGTALLGSVYFLVRPEPTPRTLRAAVVLRTRLQQGHETRFVADLIRFLRVTGARHGELPALRGELFVTLSRLGAREAKALSAESRAVLRGWLSAHSTTDAETITLLLVLGAAQDTRSRKLAQRLLSSPHDGVREAARELLASW